MDGIVGYSSDMNEKQVEDLIKQSIKGRFIKHSFSYPFRIKTNVELYHIIYATPNPKGLIKIKDSLWTVFNGDCFFKNGTAGDQLSLFDEKEFKEMNVQNFSREAQELLLAKYSTKTVDYQTICEFVLEYTMLKDSHIINYLLKPLVEQGKIIKNNIKGTRDYKNDFYTFIKVENFQEI